MGRMRWAALGALALAVLVIGLDLTVLNVALPTLSQDLAATTVELQWIVDAYVLAFAGAMLPAGWLGDRFGRGRVLQGGLAAFGVASVAAAYCASASSLVVARVAMGLAAAFVMPLAMALVPALFPGGQRQRAVTVMVAAVGLGLPLGPVVGGLLLDRFWWGSVFLVTAPIVALSLAACLLLLPADDTQAGPRPDGAGGFAAVVGIVALTYGLVQAPTWGWMSPPTWAVLASAAIALAVCVRREGRAATPLIPRPLLSSAAFVRGTVVTAVLTFVLTGVLFLLPMYLQLVLHFDAKGTGLRLAPFMVALVVGGALADRAAARLPVAAAAGTGLAGVAAGSLVLSRLDVGSGYLHAAIGLSVAGFGVGLAMAAVMDRVLAALPPSAEGIGSAVNNTARQVASALGVALLGSVTATVYGSAADRAAIGLPSQARATVHGSLAGAHSIAADLPTGTGRRLAAAADAAFVDGLTAAMLVCAVACAVAALCAPFLLSSSRLPGAVRRGHAAQTEATRSLLGPVPQPRRRSARSLELDVRTPRGRTAPRGWDSSRTARRHHERTSTARGGSTS